MDSNEKGSLGPSPEANPLALFRRRDFDEYPHPHIDHLRHQE